MNTTITAEKRTHRGNIRIFLLTRKSTEFINAITKIEGSQWSRTHRAWHVPYTTQSWNAVKSAFPTIKTAALAVQQIEQTPKQSTPQNNYPLPSACRKDALSKGTRKPNIQLVNTKNGPRQTVVEQKLIVLQWDNFWLDAYVPFDKTEWIQAIKRIYGRQWNVERTCWFLPLNKKTLLDVKDFFKEDLVLHVEEHADLPDKWYHFPKKQTGFDKLNNTQHKALTALEERLMLEGKSWRTIKSYKNHLIALMLHYPDAKPSSLSIKQLEGYILYKKRESAIATSTHNSYISAFNAFYGRVCGQEEKVLKLVRPKKKKKLPKILSKGEVKTLLNATENLKHKAMLFLIYSSGLRKGELLNLKVRDLNATRACIFVRDAKGGKDRYVVYAEKAQKIIAQYISTYKPRYWLFEGPTLDKYSETGLQKVFIRTKERAKVNPDITIHGLRHSFATHMVDNNVPLHAVQQLLGHESIKTTEIYLHLSKKYLESIKSPLDDLDI